MDPKPKKVSPTELLDSIAFTSENVVAAAEEQPWLFARAIEYRMECMRNRGTAKLAYESTRATQELKYRNEAKARGDKLTEGNIDALILLDKTVTAAFKLFTTAEEFEEYSKLILEAMRMRRDCLRIVGDLTRDDMSVARAAAIQGERMEELRNKVDKRFPGGR